MALFEEIVHDLIDDTYENYHHIFQRLYDMSMNIENANPDDPTRRWIQVICKRMQITMNKQIINCSDLLFNNSNPLLNHELEKYYKELNELLYNLQMLSLYV